MQKLMFAATTLLCAATVHAGDLPWAKDWQAAKSDAEKSNKLIMVDFYTDWCGWCKKLDKDTYTDEKVIKLAAQFACVKLNAEKEGKEQAVKYGVQGYPTILFVQANGDVVGRIGGYMKPEPFAAEMTKIAQSVTDLAKARETLAKNPDDPAANAKVAAILGMRGDIAGAEAALAKAEKAGASGDTVGEACNAIGDHYQNLGSFDKAVGFFARAASEKMSSKVRSYALVSIVACHMSAQNTEKAKEAAKKLVELKDADSDHVEYAKRVLGGEP
ncbi:MAG: Thiol:disulfide interchange protein DsbD [Phycisphaerae bacterium]|nr:Thiol:disulfide interchange protein DsbD [Phycisphaerae bacterium]